VSERYRIKILTKIARVDSIDQFGGFDRIMKTSMARRRNRKRRERILDGFARANAKAATERLAVPVVQLSRRDEREGVAKLPMATSSTAGAHSDCAMISGIHDHALGLPKLSEGLRA